MAKLYFNSFEPEVCYSKSYHIDYMRMENLPEITLTEAQREVGSSMFFCRDHHEVGDKSEGGCGKICKSYAPKNGKSGCCKHRAPVYSPTDRKITIKNKDFKANDRNLCEWCSKKLDNDDFIHFTPHDFSRCCVKCRNEGKHLIM